MTTKYRAMARTTRTGCRQLRWRLRVAAVYRRCATGPSALLRSSRPQRTRHVASSEWPKGARPLPGVPAD